MNKKILFLISILLLLVLSLIVLTGCENKQDNPTGTGSSEKSEAPVSQKESEFKNEKNIKNLSYKYPDNAEFTTETETQAVLEFKEDDKKLFSTIISYRSNSTTTDYYKSRGASETDITSKEINGKKWSLFTYSDDKTYSQCYAYQYDDNNIYIISFPMDANNKVDINDFIEEFMNNISFK